MNIFSYTLEDAKEAIDTEGLTAKYFKETKITDPQEIHNSEIFKNIFYTARSVEESIQRRLSNIEKGVFKNWRAYIVGEDVYEIYTIEENFSILRKIESGCMLSSAGFNQVVEVDDGFAVIARNWKNCKENRKAFAQGNYIVTTSL